jgi:hypothetical protein
MILYRTVCLLISCLAICTLANNQAFASAQNTGTNTRQWQKFSPNRYRLSLDGTWHVTDTQDIKDKPITIPGILTEAGEARLTRQFFLPDSLKDKAIFLHVLGINYQGRISVNDSPVASHAGGYTSFESKLEPSLLNFGEENRITIEINDKLSPRTTLPFKHRPFGWQHHGGILREIFLEARPSVSIGSLQVRQKFSNSYKDVALEIDVPIDVFYEINDTLSQAKNFTFYSEVFEAGQSKAIAVSSKNTLEWGVQGEKVNHLTIELKNVKKWQLEQPYLYLLTTYLLAENDIVDSVTIPIGFRNVKIEKKRFVLNGEPFIVKGITWQDDLCGLPEGELENALNTMMGRLKALGVNCLRVIGHPPHPRLVELCSREGIFLLEEIPLYYANAAQLQSEEIADLALQQLDEMVGRDRLQPAVLAWGLGVNLDEQDGAADKLLARLADQAKSRDDRPVYIVRRHHSGKPLHRALDFALVDYFCETELSVATSNSFSKPVLPILGYWVENDDRVDLNLETEWKRNEAEEIHAEKLQKIFDLYQSDWPDSSGFFVHTLSDWRSSQPLLSAGIERDLFVYPAGLIAGDGHQRIGFRMVASYYLQERRPPISPDKITAETPVVFPLTGIITILVLLFFVNRDKKLRVQLRRVFVHPHGFYSDMLENRRTPAFLTFVLGGVQGVIFALILTSFFYTYRENLLFNEIIELLVPSPRAKSILIWLVWHPGWMIASLATIYFILMVFLAFFLRIVATLFHSSLSFFQYFTLVFWTAANYIPLVFIAPILYRLLPEKEFAFYGFFGIGIFIFWHFVRLQRGLRVFYIISPVKSMLLCLFIVSLILGPILFYYHRTQAIFDYWGYYAALVW